MITVPHLETDMTRACQLSCVACNHATVLWRKQKGGPPRAYAKQVEKDLTALAKILHADVWGALGGEPLMNPELVEILSVVQNSGIADEMEVWTNGLLLRSMPQAFWESFDVLVLSVYEGKHTPESLAWIISKCQAAGVKLVVKDERVYPNFRTWLEQTPTGPMETATKYYSCFFRQYCRVVDNGFFFTCCCAPSVGTLIQGKPWGTDGVSISILTEDLLREYLEGGRSLDACAVCAGRDTAVPIPWREETDSKRWLALSAGRVL